METLMRKVPMSSSRTIIVLGFAVATAASTVRAQPSPGDASPPPLAPGSRDRAAFTPGLGGEAALRYGGLIDPALGDPTLTVGLTGKIAWRFKSTFGVWLRVAFDGGGRKSQGYVALPGSIGVETFARALLGSSIDANVELGVVGQPIASCGTTTVASCDAAVGGFVALRLIPGLTAATVPRGNLRLTTGLDLSVMYAPLAKATVVAPLLVIGMIYY